MKKPTLREQNKSEKLRRIRLAARDLFGTKGFDATSTREIAQQARVGLATLFLYASDKRDLLFLVLNDDLEDLTARAFATIDPEQRLVDQLLEAFRAFYEFYACNRQLSRDLLRELTFYTTGRESERFQATRQRTIREVRHLIERARARGEVNDIGDDDRISQVIFYVFAAEVRKWLDEAKSSVSDGLEELGALFQIVLAGIAGKGPTR